MRWPDLQVAVELPLRADSGDGPGSELGDLGQPVPAPLPVRPARLGRPRPEQTHLTLAVAADLDLNRLISH